MKDELAAMVGTSAPHASLSVRSESWDLYVFGVTPVGRDMFLQIAAVGPRVCTLTVRAPAPIGNVATARRILAIVHDWILANCDSDQAYLELPRIAELAS
jgi:hypothetical protein